MVVPFLGSDVMSWYRKFKASIGEAPRTWCLFKEHIRARFRDSDFELKLLTKMYDQQATGTQQEYTFKFMLLLSQSTVEMPEVVKRLFYQQNLRSDTSSYICQNIPTSLHDTIEHAQLLRMRASRPGRANRLEPRRRMRKAAKTDGTHRVVDAVLGPVRPLRRLHHLSRSDASCGNSAGADVLHVGVMGHKLPECLTKGSGAPKN
ncbi:hypothetical protein L915_01403 [Phytophthora nicotianae]|uniref:Retrotransposon gag domain-containing protein n=1 Tax=Phytophthora nicotianae TaxID=4792 RepID=W2HM92_PHYNI|nr:hypothetical protein L915_01403 [Phytophthora nicotianae]